MTVVVSSLLDGHTHAHVHTQAYRQKKFLETRCMSGCSKMKVFNSRVGTVSDDYHCSCPDADFKVLQLYFYKLYIAEMYCILLLFLVII